ncbi:MAG TPA: DMT family transporter [Acidimicrobiia bacterium]|nr:DMT family transporter [Acidimicrobiia bacterium]
MPDRATLIAFVSFVILGGVNFVAVRFSNRELEPMFGAGLRFTAAALILTAVFALRRQVVPRGRALVGVLLYGVLSFFIAYAFAYYALTALPAGIGSVIFASMPLFVVFLAHFHGLERFRLRALVGAVVTLVGIAILSDPFGSSVPLLPLLAMVASAVAAAEGTVVAKMFPPVKPAVANALAMASGGALLLLLSAVLREVWVWPELPETQLAVGYLVLASAVMFALFLFVIHRWSAGSASYMAAVLPLTAVIAAAIMLGEPITLTMVLGGLVVLAGVYIGALAPARAIEPAPVIG